MHDDPLMDPPATADYLGTSVPALAQMRYRGDGPPFIRMTARKIRYRRSDVDGWLSSRTRTRTDDRTPAA
ncbi:AlpA family transcriptional regulator [Haloactinopolyspora alba]|uniref:AlpA family transcriptional regulator n=1 Tax=Haloactinopolyspora alba TaxID=648780 RepID=A0A2P8DZ56_9ACTN|nr:helix-turn-helix domain-containing protein [Haloactinopolyspora alba]PSL02508.1 AlpA family transcriptional regulator [Haloactinopolyspora alba]